MGWFYYLSDNLVFPIDVVIRFALRGNQSELKPAQIVDLDPKSEQGSSLRLGISEPGSHRVQYISPTDIASMDTTPENTEIINDWLYWHDHEML